RIRAPSSPDVLRSSPAIALLRRRQPGIRILLRHLVILCMLLNLPHRSELWFRSNQDPLAGLERAVALATWKQRRSGRLLKNGLAFERHGVAVPWSPYQQLPTQSSRARRTSLSAASRR